VDDALLVAAQRVDRDANSAQLRSSVSTCTRLSWSLISAAVGVPSVGRVWSAVASVRSGGGPCAGEAQAVERLRAGHLVHEVQVDEQEVRRDLVGRPDLLEQGRGHG
jgi:hypothetical protein